MEGLESQIVTLLLVLLLFLLALLEAALVRRREKRRRIRKRCGGTGRYTEVHCHILPGVDDGAPDMRTAVALLRQEQAQGVGNVILTPHLRRRENDYRKIWKRFRELEKKAGEEGIAVRLHLGSEIYYDSETLQNLREGRAFTMAGGRYVLLEFPPGVRFPAISSAVDEMVMAGYFPVLAHVERYGCIARHLERAGELKEKGAYIQVNAGSFLKHPKRKELLAMAQGGLVDLVGTDCHRTDWRPVCMRDTCRHLARHLAREDYRRIFFGNPRGILEDRAI